MRRYRLLIQPQNSPDRVKTSPVPFEKVPDNPRREYAANPLISPIVLKSKSRSGHFFGQNSLYLSLICQFRSRDRFELDCFVSQLLLSLWGSTAFRVNPCDRNVRKRRQSGFAAKLDDGYPRVSMSMQCFMPVSSRRIRQQTLGERMLLARPSALQHQDAASC
jgi:hypothetical protein